MIKRLAIFGSTIIFLLILLYAIGYWNNNRHVDYPSERVIKHSFDRSVSWLQSNQERIMTRHNSALWWMIKKASEISDDKRLKNIFSDYNEEYILVHYDNLWASYFDRKKIVNVPDIAMLNAYSNYQLFLIYGLTCSPKLARTTVIRSQLSPDYCELHFLHPRCVTHQMMAARLLLERNCLDKYQLNPLISSLQNIIVTELTWDFRVGDAYIQRLLMLEESGASSLIKPVWIKRFLNAQNVDGGWDDIDPLIPLSQDYAFSFTSVLPKVTRKQKSDFHATAQAVLLLALLSHKQQTERIND